MSKNKQKRMESRDAYSKNSFLAWNLVKPASAQHAQSIANSWVGL